MAKPSEGGPSRASEGSIMRKAVEKGKLAIAGAVFTIAGAIAQKADAQLTAEDANHLGAPFTPDHLEQGDHARNRSKLAVGLDAEGEPIYVEFDFFVDDRGTVYAQACSNGGPDEQGEPTMICRIPTDTGAESIGGYYGTAIVFQLPQPNDDQGNPVAPINKLLLTTNHSEAVTYTINLNEEGDPRVDFDTLDEVRADVRNGDTLAHGTIEIDGVATEGILYNNVNILKFYNPLTQEITVIGPREGLGLCGPYSQGLLFDVPRDSRDSRQCRIVIDAEFAIATNLFGRNARYVETDDGLRYISYDDPVDRTTRVVLINTNGQVEPTPDGGVPDGGVADGGVVEDMGAGGAGGTPAEDGGAGGQGGEPDPDAGVVAPDQGMGGVVSPDAGEEADAGEADAADEPDSTAPEPDAAERQDAAPPQTDMGQDGEPAPDMGQGGQGGEPAPDSAPDSTPRADVGPDQGVDAEVDGPVQKVTVSAGYCKVTGKILNSGAEKLTVSGLDSCTIAVQVEGHDEPGKIKITQGEGDEFVMECTYFPNRPKPLCVPMTPGTEGDLSEDGQGIRMGAGGEESLALGSTATKFRLTFLGLADNGDKLYKAASKNAPSDPPVVATKGIEGVDVVAILPNAAADGKVREFGFRVSANDPAQIEQIDLSKLDEVVTSPGSEGCDCNSMGTNDGQPPVALVMLALVALRRRKREV